MKMILWISHHQIYINLRKKITVVDIMEVVVAFMHIMVKI